MTNSKIRLVLADDHTILLDGLRAMLKNQQDIEVVGFYNDGQKLWDDLENTLPIKVALLDISMPGLDGLQLTKKIKEKHPEIKCLILSMYDDENHVMDLIDAQADGYLLKNVGDMELLTAIRKLADGGVYYSQEVTDLIATVIKRGKSKCEAPQIPKITPREIDILKLIAEELKNAEIAERLHISESTVETHRKNMMRKIGVNNAVGLLKYGIENGLL